MSGRLHCWTLVAVALVLSACGGDVAVPRAEHPRPELARDDWVSLNGEWDFRFDPADLGVDERWFQPNAPFDRAINVPFCWESPLSGVQDTSGREIGWYRRRISVPSEWEGAHVWLRFEAVHRDVTAWVDGNWIGADESGSGPVEFDITDHLAPGDSASLVVRVYNPPDPATAVEHTTVSGIWQMVWLEARPTTYVDALAVIPRNEGGSWSVDVAAVVRGTDGTATVGVRTPDSTIAPADEEVRITEGMGEFRATLDVSSPRVWTPSSPELYNLEIAVTPDSGSADLARTYTALRTFEYGSYEGFEDEIPLLNGEPVLLRCATDYSKNPEGAATAPSDEFLRRDLELARSMGLNCLRVSAGAGDTRLEWWADQFGLLIVDVSVEPGQSGDTTPLLPGGGDRDISWNLRNLTTLTRKERQGGIAPGVALADYEFAHNGLFNYDRTPKEFGYDGFVEEMTVADLLGDDFVGFDTPPVLVAEPGATISVPIFVSHFSDREGEIMVRPWLTGVDDLGADVRVDLDLREVTWEKFAATPQRPLGVRLPADRGFVGALAMELLADGERIGANYVNVVAVRPQADASSTQRLDLAGPRRVALRRSPVDPARTHWTGSGVPSLAAQRSELEKFYFHGAGSVEYRFDAPQAVLDAGPVRMGLLAELGTKARDEKLDWSFLTNPLDYPQTDTRKLPGTVQININGEYLDPIELADDPADSRGVLSHMAGAQYGSYGYLVRGELLLGELTDVTAQLRSNPVVRVVMEVFDDERANGLSVYGDASGLFPIDPTVIIETERDIEWE